MNIANDCGSGHNRFRRSQEIWNRGQLDQHIQISLGHGCCVLQALATVRWDDDACIREWYSPKNAFSRPPAKAGRHTFAFIRSQFNARASDGHPVHRIDLQSRRSY